ncbi:MAG: glycoside hydrolase family 28 protein [Chitinophagaceae bacterium]
MRRLILLNLLLFAFTANLNAAPGSPGFNVRDFGAKGDSATLDTDAINAAIIAAFKAGGGTVYFPAGVYASYSIHLQSHISLFLDQGATLLAAIPVGNAGYDSPEPAVSDSFQDYGHSHWRNSLIWGENLEDISILGPGTIFGNGLSRGGPMRAPVGNKAIALKLCRNVILKDFTILFGGHFGILATGLDNLTIDNLKIDTNRDGLDIDCCRNVHISNCSVNAPWDDAICLKSSYALGFARATENVTITNCHVSGYDRGSFIKGTYQRKEWNLVPDKEGPTGRIKMGTESNGGFKNIAISNCVFDYCRGLALETVDGGLLEDVTISNITMRDIVNSPIFLRLGARLRGPAGTQPGALRRIRIINISVYNADAHFAILISGIPGHPIEDIQLSHISVWYRPIDSATTKIQLEVPEFEKGYPEPHKFGVLPAYGFFIRHVNGLEMDHIQTRLMGVETRAAMVMTDVNQVRLFNVSMDQAATAPLLVLKDVNKISIKDCSLLKDMKIETAASKIYR